MSKCKGIRHFCIAKTKSNTPVIIEKMRNAIRLFNTHENHKQATNIGCKFSKGTRKQKYSLKHKPPKVSNAPPRAKAG